MDDGLTSFPRLYAIVDAELAERTGFAPLRLARAFLDGGAKLLQLRAKHTTSGQFLRWCEEIVEAARDYRAALIVNDRADVARLARAGGVHVGQHDLSPASVRGVLGDSGIVGLSTHTLQQIDAAAAEPIDYIAVGPIFQTATKATGFEAVGFELIEHACGAGSQPVVAIGGIRLDTARAVIEAGAASVAVISDLLATGDPESRVRAYLERLGEEL